MMCRNDKSGAGPEWKHNTYPQFLSVMKAKILKYKNVKKYKRQYSSIEYTEIKKREISMSLSNYTLSPGRQTGKNHADYSLYENGRKQFVPTKQKRQKDVCMYV